MTDYTEEEREAVRQRAARALESCDATLQSLAEREAANREARLLGETRSQAPQAPPPIPPPRRPPQDGRNWVEEARYIEEVAAPVVDRKIEANNEMLAEAIGGITKDERRIAKEALDRAIEGLRAEMRLALAEAMTSLMAAVAGDAAKFDARLARLDRLLARWETLDEDEDDAPRARSRAARLVN